MSIEPISHKLIAVEPFTFNQTIIMQDGYGKRRPATLQVHQPSRCESFFSHAIVPVEEENMMNAADAIEQYLDETEGFATTTGMIRTLDEAGFAIVPKKLDRQMLDACWNATRIIGDHPKGALSFKNKTRARWEAMLNAARKYVEPDGVTIDSYISLEAANRLVKTMIKTGLIES